MCCSVVQAVSVMCILNAITACVGMPVSRCDKLIQKNCLQASSFMMFPDMHTACRAASVLRTETAVDAVEVFDRAALRWVHDCIACCGWSHVCTSSVLQHSMLSLHPGDQQCTC